MGEFRRLIQEQVLDDDAVHRAQGRSNVLRVRIRLSNVLALDVESLELAIERSLEHVRDAKSWLGEQLPAPGPLELTAHRRIGHVPIGRELVRERSHIARALDIVLPTQWIDADP